MPAQRLVEQRGDRGRGAVDRVGRAGVRGELHPGADGADVRVVEQLVLRHRDRDLGEVGFARLGLQDRPEGRVAAALGRPDELDVQLRVEAEAGAVGGLEVGLTRVTEPPSSPEIVASTENGSQLVGLSVKPGRSRLTTDRARPQRDPFEDLRQRVGDRADLGGDRVDRDGDPDGDVAEVVGPGDRRNDDEQAQRRALIWTGEVDLPRRVERVGARRRRR